MSDAMTQKFGEYLIYFSNALALPVERNFKPDVFTSFAANNWWLCFTLVTLYLAGIFGGRKIMENFKPFDLRLALAAWNAFLCVFSFIGMCRTVSFLLIHFNEYKINQFVFVAPSFDRPCLNQAIRRDCLLCCF